MLAYVTDYSIEYIQDRGLACKPPGLAKVSMTVSVMVKVGWIRRS
jgi:hypothetical protein